MQSKVNVTNTSNINMSKYVANTIPTSSNITKDNKGTSVEKINLADSTILSSINSVSNSNASSVVKFDSKSAYSITSHSDKDNVCINQIRYIIRDYKNSFIDYQKEDSINYFTAMLKSKYNMTDAEATSYAQNMYKILIDSASVTSINDIFNDSKLKNKYKNTLLADADFEKCDENTLTFVENKIDRDDVKKFIKDYMNTSIDYLDLYYSYLEGRTLSDAMNKDNYSNYLYDKLKKNVIATNDSELNYYLGRYDSILSKFETSLNPKKYDMSYELRQSVITEIVDEDGYDAMVLKLTNGNTAVVNSCTNEKEDEDMLSIIGNIASLACEDDFSKDLFKNIFLDAHDINTPETTIYSDAQINACVKIIKKYIDQGKDMELYGYSLGGGIMEAAYARILEEGDKKYTDKIKSVCVYNPFTLIAEQDSENGINLLANNRKFLRYCAEGDVVSTFNHYNKELDNNTLYLRAAAINSVEWFQQKGKNNACKPTDLFTGGNHSFTSVNNYVNSSFDINGNVTFGREGKYISISNVINALNDNFMGPAELNEVVLGSYKYNRYDDSLNIYDLDECMKISFPVFGKMMLERAGIDMEKYKDFEPVINDLLEYCGNNFGNIKYRSINGEDSMGSIIGEFLEDYIYDQAKDEQVVPDDAKKNVATKVLKYFPALAPSAFVATFVAEKTISAKDFIERDEFKSAIRYVTSQHEYTVFKLINGILKDDGVETSKSVDDLVVAIVKNYNSNMKGPQIIDKSSTVLDKLESALKSRIKEKIPNCDTNTYYSRSDDAEYRNPYADKVLQDLENGTYDGGGLIAPNLDTSTSTTVTTTTVAK